MFVYKKNVLKKQEKKKFVYKYKYNANFLSKQKKNINDVEIFKLNSLLYNDQLPLINKETGKFVFKKEVVGKISYGNSQNALTSQKLNTGRLLFVNKNKV